MTIREELQTFFEVSNIEELENYYEQIMANGDFSNVNKIYDLIVEELNKQAPIMQSPKGEKEEFEQMRDEIFSMNTPQKDRQLLATAMLDGLVVERIKNYCYKNNKIEMCDALHDEYLAWLEEDEEENF